MARKKIREYDSKRLLSRHLRRLREEREGTKTGNERPAVAAAATPERRDSGANIGPVDDPNDQLVYLCAQVSETTSMHEVESMHPWLLERKLVVKPDMLFGQRGKHGLVKLNISWEEARSFLHEKLGSTISINGATGAQSHFIVEPFLPHDDEYYFSINSQRDCNELVFSAQGGVEIEDNWDAAKTLKISADLSVSEAVEYIREHLTPLVPEERREVFVNFACDVYRVFDDCDYTLVEMNPLTFDRERGHVVPLDMRGELDDTAAYMSASKWGDVEQWPHPFGQVHAPEEDYIEGLDAKTGASLKLTVLNPNGRIWAMVAGGGASVIFADTVSDLGYGEELGNYGEYSGNPNEEETFLYAKTLIELATRNPDGRRRALLIGGGVANFTDIAKTFKGIAHALREYKQQLIDANMKIFVRRAGPNYKAGLATMRKLGEELGVPMVVYGLELRMTEIIPMAINWVKSSEEA